MKEIKKSKPVKIMTVTLTACLSLALTACSANSASLSKTEIIDTESPKGMSPLIATYVEKLSSPNTTEQVYGAHMLGRMGSRGSSAVPELVGNLNNSSVIVKRAVLEALSLIGDKSAGEPIIALLKDRKSNVRGEAAHALGALRDRNAADALIETLKDNTIADSGIINEVAWALGEIASFNAEEPLIDLLRNHADVASNALWEINPSWQNSTNAEKMIDKLISELNSINERDLTASGIIDTFQVMGLPAMTKLESALIDDGFYNQKILAKTLEKLGWHPSDLKEKVNFLVAGERWEEIIKEGEPAVEILVANLGDINKSIRANSAKALVKLKWSPANDDEKVGNLIAYRLWNDLAKIGDPAIERLIGVLGDRDANIRSEAAETLIKIGHATIKPLISALIDKNESKRSSAALILSKLDAEWHHRDEALKSAPEFIEKLKDKDDSVRCSAAWALSEIKDPNSVPKLVEVLKDDNAGVRQYTVTALGKIGTEAALRPLIDMLSDENSAVRGYAALALGEIRNFLAIEPLLSTMRDKDDWPRSCARKALQMIDKNWAGTEAAKRAIPEFISSLNAEYRALQRDAAKVLGDIKDKSAVEPLIAKLDDSNEEIRSNAARALGSIGDVKAVKPLIKALSNKETRTAGMTYALGEIGDPIAVESLIEALDDKNLSTYAARALVKITGEKFGENKQKWEEWMYKNANNTLKISLID